MLDGLQKYPTKPEQHRITQFIREGKITIYQLSLRLHKSYSHTCNLINGYAEISSQQKEILNEIMKTLGEQ